MNNNQISKACFWASLTSVAGSIAVWSLTGDTDLAHAERFGIFIGLWAPTLMGLANWFKSRYASGSGAVWQRIWFGTRGSQVQIQPPDHLG